MKCESNWVTQSLVHNQCNRLNVNPLRWDGAGEHQWKWKLQVNHHLPILWDTECDISPSKWRIRTIPSLKTLNVSRSPFPTFARIHALVMQSFDIRLRFNIRRKFYFEKVSGMVEPCSETRPPEYPSNIQVCLFFHTPLWSLHYLHRFLIFISGFPHDHPTTHRDITCQDRERLVKLWTRKLRKRTPRRATTRLPPRPKSLFKVSNVISAIQSVLVH
jgi:hypothetical protein